MLSLDPNDRPSIGEVLKSPWFDKYYPERYTPVEKISTESAIMAAMASADSIPDDSVGN